MLPKLLAAVAVSGTLVSAWTSTSYSKTTASVCSTLYGSGKTAPTPIPSTTTTRVTTKSSNLPAYTVDAVVRVTVATTTTTQYTSIVPAYAQATISSPTFTSVVIQYSTIATATIPTTQCTNGVVPTTVTKYSGTYKPVSGQDTKLPATYPTSVLCYEDVTSFLGLIPIVTTTVTNTETATSAVFAPTTTVTNTWTYGTTTVYGTTTTSTSVSLQLASTVAYTRTACEATYTTTYAAKCAPTNLIGAINNVGLVSNTYAANITVNYGIHGDSPYEHDSSLCCQLCVDNKGCAGVMTGMDQACGLLYVGGPDGKPECGVHAFNYGTQKNVYPGQGLVVQSGCGSIAYAG